MTGLTVGAEERHLRVARVTVSFTGVAFDDDLKPISWHGKAASASRFQASVFDMDGSAGWGAVSGSRSIAESSNANRGLASRDAPRRS